MPKLNPYPAILAAVNPKESAASAKPENIAASGDEEKGCAERPGKKTAKRPPTGSLVRYPGANGGALRFGRPRAEQLATQNYGIPATAIRDRLRGSFYDRVPLMEKIADDESEATSDRLAALGLMARYGIGQQLDVQGEIRSVAVVIRREA